MKFAVIGGDMRQAKLAELLALDGHEVSAFAIDKIRLEGGVSAYGLVKDAVSGADCVVFPLPLASTEGLLNAPLSSGLHTTHEVINVLTPGQLVCAGRVDETAREAAGSAGIELIDYLDREELAVLNAVATAEGAIGLVMQETAITVWRSKILVIGFGRIGQLLCHRLRGMGASITASARSYADFAWIEAYGYEKADTNGLDSILGDFDIVINTVPARVLGEQRLSKLKKSCLCLDLASKPGGLDFSAASKLGVKAMWALSLPGEVAPVTSVRIIKDTVYNILRERGAKI